MNKCNNLIESINKQWGLGGSIVNAILEMQNSVTMLNSHIVENICFFAKINELNEDDYKKEFQERVLRAENLGKAGWVISQYNAPDVEKEILYLMQNGKQEKDFVSLFYPNEKVIETRLNDLKSKYQSKSLLFYYNKFEECFGNADYTSAAVYICSLFERRIKFFSNKYRRMSKKVNEGFLERQTNYFNEKSKRQDMFDVFVLNDYLPSLKTFAERVFLDDKYTFDCEVEPPYLNRNWLCHGYLTKPVEKYQVLQVLNALDTLEVVIEADAKFASKV